MVSQGTPKKYVILFGAAAYHIPMIETARELGLGTIVIDVNAGAPGMALADVRIPVSRDDVFALCSRCIDLVEEYNYEIIGLYCGIDIGLTPYVLAGALGIPYASPKTALLCLDKGLARQALANAGLPVAKGVVLGKKDPGRWDCFPCIVKPLASSGSQGVSKVETPGELPGARVLAGEFAKDGRVLIEEYLSGSLNDANGFMRGGVFYPTAASSRVRRSDKPAVTRYTVYPPLLETVLVEKMFSRLEDAARAVGLTDGPIKGDFIVTDDGEIFIIEISPRFHSYAASDLSGGPKLKNFSLEQYFRACLGMCPAPPSANPAGPCGSLFLTCKPGRITSLPDAGDLARIPGVDAVIHYRKVGDVVGPLQSSAEFCGLVMAHAESHESLFKLFEILENRAAPLTE